jgi:hypothetical protein
LPTSRQITNYVNNTLKPKVVVVNFNYASLTKWIPESEDEIFVIDSVININDLIPKGISFYIHFITIYIFLNIFILKHLRFVYHYQQKN